MKEEGRIGRWKIVSRCNHISVHEFVRKMCLIYFTLFLARINKYLPDPEGEIREMIDIYESRGMNREDATQVIETMAKYKDFFVDIMMTEELALQVPEEGHKIESMKEGVVMFCAFATFGSLPLLGYVIIPALFPTLGEEVLFTAACIITGLVLFGMGW